MTEIPEHKIYDALNGCLFDKEMPEHSERFSKTIVGFFKENKVENCIFDAETFNKLYKGVNCTTEERIDCICYLMKCVLANKKVFEIYSKIYDSVLDNV